MISAWQAGWSICSVVMSILLCGDGAWSCQQRDSVNKVDGSQVLTQASRSLTDRPVLAAPACAL